jgi:hypothetical protein
MMKREDMEKEFEKESGRFEDLPNKRARSRDIHAFLLLEELLPEDGCIISAAEHDIIYLDIDADQFANVATPEIIQELIACGVHLESDIDCLAMFV